MHSFHEARDFFKDLPTCAYLSDQLLGLTGERGEAVQVKWTFLEFSILKSLTQSAPKDLLLALINLRAVSYAPCLEQVPWFHLILSWEPCLKERMPTDAWAVAFMIHVCLLSSLQWLMNWNVFCDLGPAYPSHLISNCFSSCALYSSNSKPCEVPILPK